MVAAVVLLLACASADAQSTGSGADRPLGLIEYLNGVLHDIDLELDRIARRQPGCRALMAHYGIGTLVATAIVAELGDTRRMSSSKQAVRCAGLDITVHQSDERRRAGHLSRQGSPVLRWAVFEAAQCASRPASPDHADYVQHALSSSTTRGVWACCRASK